MKKIPFALLSVGTLLGAPLAAQTTSPTLAPVTVTGNPLGANDSIAPVSQLSGTELLLRAKSSLGETLDGTPGISSTYFGPNASRPVIRGLDGDRIRILNNGAGLLDASSLSYDHAATADPLSLTRIEVLRGPAALLYGGNAVGGVVNVIDNRIAREPGFDAQGGLSGQFDLGLTRGDRGQGAAVALGAGTDRYAVHVDAFQRHAGDVAVPVDLACSRPGAPAVARRICNSASQTHGGAVGASAFFSQGYLGASLSGFRSDYGTVAEDEVTIGMKSDRASLEGELRGLSGWLQSVKAQVSASDYAHTEFEGAVTGTVFKSRGHDLRLQARHARLGPLEGVVGVQLDSVRFSADGAEAFAPHSRTRQTALFLHEELPTTWGRLSFGARRESLAVASLGSPLADRFAPASRRFQPASYALGAMWKLAPGWQLSSNLAHTERAPKDYELFANGPHLATSAYELGQPDLALERSTNLELGVNWKAGTQRAALSAFVNRFNNYIALQATGASQDELPEYAYTQTPARFYGLEASASQRLWASAGTLDLELRADLVRAVDERTGQALARIAPARAGATLLWAQGPWSARLGANLVAAQTRVPTDQARTAGYTLWNAAVSYRIKARATEWLWFAQVENLGDALAYSASSILTQTAPGKAPLPGRHLKLGLRLGF
jgi:iron complex outermembrane recepter protein